MPIVVSHVYDFNIGNNFFFVGHNFRTNFHQRLRQNNGVFYYINATGHRYYFSYRRNSYGQIIQPQQLANEESGLWLHERRTGTTVTHRVLIDRSGNSLVFSRHGHLIEMHQFPSTFENPLNGLLLRINYVNQPADRTQVNTYRIANITNTHSTVNFIYNNDNVLQELTLNNATNSAIRLASFTYVLSNNQRQLQTIRRLSVSPAVDTRLSYVTGTRLRGVDEIRGSVTRRHITTTVEGGAYQYNLGAHSRYIMRHNTIASHRLQIDYRTNMVSGSVEPQREYRYNNIRQNTQTYRFSSENQLNRIQRTNAANQTHTINYQYDNDNRLQQTTTAHSNGGNFRDQFSYRSRGGATTSNQLSWNGFFVNNQNRAMNDFTWHPNGNLRSILRRIDGITQTTEFHYDAHNRLRTEICTTFNTRTEFTYNNGGNIIRREVFDRNTGRLISTDTWSYGDSSWRDLLTAFNGEPIIYDDVGNPTWYRGRSLTWKNGRQLASVGLSSPVVGSRQVLFEYDFSGIRTRKTTMEFARNGWSVFGFWQTVSDIRFLVEGARILGQVEMVSGLPTSGITWFYYDASGVSGMRHNGVDYYFERNILGSVVGIWNMQTGALVGRQGFDAWGNLLYMLPAGTGAAYLANRAVMEFNPFRWKGYYYDSSTSFYYLQSRYYDPVIGRFINADDPRMLFTEAMMPMGGNLFMYCLNNPVMFRDDTGYGVSLSILILIGAIVGAAVGGLYGGLTAYENNDNIFWGILGGMITGAIMGAGAAFGSAAFAGWLAGKYTLGFLAFGLGTAFGTGVVGGFVSDSITQRVNHGSVDSRRALNAGLRWGTLNLMSSLLGVAFPGTGVPSQVLIAVGLTWGFAALDFLNTINSPNEKTAAVKREVFTLVTAYYVI